MAHRTVRRILSSALEGVPFRLRSVEPPEGARDPRRFDVTLTIDDVSLLRAREGSLFGSLVTLVTQEPGAGTSQVQGTVVAVLLLEHTDVGGASLRLSVAAVPDDAEDSRNDASR